MSWATPKTNFAVGDTLTAAEMNNIGTDLSLNWHELSYIEVTTSVSSSTATEASPLDVVSSGSITCNGNVLLIQFYTPNMAISSNNNAGISLWEDSSDIGRLWDDNTASTQGGGGTFMRRHTPSASSHTYKVRLWTSGAATFTVNASTGGAGTRLPGFIRVLQQG